jgi:YycH protein.
MLISPYEAIVKIYPELDDSSVITDISLGYYFKLGETLNIKDTKTAKAFPAWRITLSDGTEKYVSALDF